MINPKAPTITGQGQGLLRTTPQPAFTPVLPSEIERLAQQQAYAGYGTQKQNRNFLQGLYGQNNSYQSQQPNQQGAVQEQQGQWMQPFNADMPRRGNSMLEAFAQARGWSPEQIQRAGWSTQPSSGGA